MVLAALTLVVTSAVVAIGYFAPVDPRFVWQEVAKAGITVVAVAVVGGVVKFLFDEHARERTAREAQAAFVMRVMMDLETIRSGVERARLLIRAHRSARSYRDRMQDLIESRVAIATLIRSLEGHWPDAGTSGPTQTAKKSVTAYLSGLGNYLDKLVSEYEQLYKPVADQQRIDEALADQAIKQYTERAGREVPEPSRPTLQWTAWTMLDSQQFPQLADFLARDDSEFDHKVASGCQQVMIHLHRLLIGVTDARRVTFDNRPAGETASGRPVGERQRGTTET